MATWWVRPDSTHGGANDGTSYEDAWQGWGEIVWGASGVAGGHTLTVCGAHVYGATIAVGNHGGSSESTICTITSDYSDDQGSITFDGSYFLSCGRSFTRLALTIQAGDSLCVYHSGALQHLYHEGGSYTGGGGNSLVNFDPATAKSYADVLFDNMRFSGDARLTSSASAAINYLVTATGAVNTMTRVTITNSAFDSLIVGRAAIHLRRESDTDASSIFTDVVIEGNTFSNVQGLCIEVADGHETLNSSAGLRIRENVARNCTPSPVSDIGGFIVAWGFGSSAALGKPLIEMNEAYTVTGALGMCNLYYGSYIVRDNYANGLYTDSIDGNGVLFDYGCDDCQAYGNRWINLAGKTGATNSGVAIMVLDSTNVSAWSNIAIGCAVGVHIGNAGAGQSCEISGNSFVGCTVYGIDVLSTADEANAAVKDNVFTTTVGARSVRNLGAAWTGEDYNVFDGFIAASGHTLGTHTKTEDPLTTAEGRPLPGSPLLTGGTGGIRRDINGVQGFNFIGAHAQAALRTR